MTLGSADGYVPARNGKASCPEGRTDCTLAHTKTQLVCEENGQVHPLGAPLLDGAWWLIDINAPKARFGYLEQDLHTGRFSSGSDRFDLTRWRSDDRVEMYTDASLSGDPIALPDAAETDRSLPVQRCELDASERGLPRHGLRSRSAKGGSLSGQSRPEGQKCAGTTYGRRRELSIYTAQRRHRPAGRMVLRGRAALRRSGIGSSPDFLRGIQLGDNLTMF